ncbi:ADP-ribosylation factor-like protein 13B [Rhizophlyctis rosea]|nr:ADP-ribosylation factor-like protein 13B [Rhizophlyctis rosea]
MRSDGATCFPFSLCVPSRRRAVPKIVVLVLGLDGAGKTSFVNWIKGETSPIPPRSTNGFTTTTVRQHLPVAAGQTPKNRGKVAPEGASPEAEGAKKAKVRQLPVDVTYYDVGGGEGIRGIWGNYFAEAHACIYVVDASNKDSIPTSASCLSTVLLDERMTGKPLLVVSNKQDTPNHISPDETYDHLRLNELAPWSRPSPTSGAPRSNSLQDEESVILIGGVCRLGAIKPDVEIGMKEGLCQYAGDEILKRELRLFNFVLEIECWLLFLLKNCNSMHLSNSISALTRFLTTTYARLPSLFARVASDVSEQKSRYAKEREEQKQRVEEYRSESLDGSGTILKEEKKEKGKEPVRGGEDVDIVQSGLQKSPSNVVDVPPPPIIVFSEPSSGTVSAGPSGWGSQESKVDGGKVKGVESAISEDVVVHALTQEDNKAAVQEREKPDQQKMVHAHPEEVSSNNGPQTAIIPELRKQAHTGRDSVADAVSEINMDVRSSATSGDDAESVTESGFAEALEHGMNANVTHAIPLRDHSVPSQDSIAPVAPPRRDSAERKRGTPLPGQIDDQESENEDGEGVVSGHGGMGKKTMSGLGTRVVSGREAEHNASIGQSTTKKESATDEEEVEGQNLSDARQSIPQLAGAESRHMITAETDLGRAEKRDPAEKQTTEDRGVLGDTQALDNGTRRRAQDEADHQADQGNDEREVEQVARAQSSEVVPAETGSKDAREHVSEKDLSDTNHTSTRDLQRTELQSPPSQPTFSHAPTSETSGHPPSPRTEASELPPTISATIFKQQAVGQGSLNSLREVQQKGLHTSTPPTSQESAHTNAAAAPPQSPSQSMEAPPPHVVTSAITSTTTITETISSIITPASATADQPPPSQQSPTPSSEPTSKPQPLASIKPLVPLFNATAHGITPDTSSSRFGSPDHQDAKAPEEGSKEQKDPATSHAPHPPLLPRGLMAAPLRPGRKIAALGGADEYEMVEDRRRDQGKKVDGDAGKKEEGGGSISGTGVEGGIGAKLPIANAPLEATPLGETPPSRHSEHQLLINEETILNAQPGTITQIHLASSPLLPNALYTPAMKQKEGALAPVGTAKRGGMNLAPLGLPLGF